MRRPSRSFRSSPPAPPLQALAPRTAIVRRLDLIGMALSDAPRRGETDEDFIRRIGTEIERLANAIAASAVDLRRGGPEGERAGELESRDRGHP